MRSSQRVMRLCEGLAAVGLIATIAHLWGGLANPIGLRIQTALSTTAWGAAELLERLPFFEDVSDGLVLLRGSLAAALIAVPLFLRARGRTFGLLAHILAPLPLAGLGAMIIYGGGMSPAAWTATLAAAVLIAPATRPPIDRPRHSRAASAAAVWLGLVGFFMLHALYVSGPGIQPALVADGGVGAWFGAALDPLSGSPWLLRGLQAGVFVLSVGASVVAQRRGFPLVPRLAAGPAGWLIPALHAALLAGAAAGPVQLLSVWKCPPPEHAGPVRVIDDRPGSFQLHVVDEGRALWSVDREGASTRRWTLPEGVPMPSIDWLALRPEAWPEEQMPTAGGIVWSALVDPHLHGSSVLIGVDAARGTRRAGPVVTDGCYVASWAPLPGGEALLLGCEYSPEFLVFRTADGAVIDRFTVPSAGSFEEIVLSADGATAYTVPLWFGAQLTAIDVEARRAESSLFLGDFNWGATSIGDILFVTRFQEGRLQSVDMARGSVLDAVHVGYGARPTTVRPGGGWVMAAATYSGRLTAVRVDDQGRFGESRSLPVGGLVRSLAASQDGSTLYFAGRCGVRALDLDAWLGPAAR